MPRNNRAVKMAEKLNSKYHQSYTNLKGITSVRVKNVLGFSPEATRGASSKILLMHVSTKQ